MSKAHPKCISNHEKNEDVCFHILDSVDCKQSDWKTIDSCTKTCGGGVISAVRSILKKAENGGKPCGPSARTMPCNTNACPSKNNQQYNFYFEIRCDSK